MKVIIAGAGPTGLTAAIELARRGIIARVVDRKPSPSPLSRAVGINPRSLKLLEANGVTAQLLERGIKIRTGHFYEDGVETGRLNIGQLPAPYNFMLALPQDETETIMRKRFEAMGGHVDYGCEVVGYKPGEKSLLALVKDGQSESWSGDIIIAADGAHSKLREIAAISFNGKTYEHDWGIADVEVDALPYAPDDMHFFTSSNGAAAILIRIGPTRWRVVASTEKAIPCVPGLAAHVTEVHRSDAFRIAVKQANAYQHGNMFLCGDAAHTHSPAGALGMNTGIADACELAWRIAAGQTAGYTDARYKQGKKVLRLSDMMASMAQTKNPLLRKIRGRVFRLLTRFPFLQRPLLQRMLVES